MSNVFSIMQVALVLGISMQEVKRLIRARRLAVHHTTSKVKYVSVDSLQSFISSQAAQAAFMGAQS